MFRRRGAVLHWTKQFSINLFERKHRTSLLRNMSTFLFPILRSVLWFLFLAYWWRKKGGLEKSCSRRRSLTGWLIIFILAVIFYLDLSFPFRLSLNTLKKVSGKKFWFSFLSCGYLKVSCSEILLAYGYRFERLPFRKAQQLQTQIPARLLWFIWHLNRPVFLRDKCAREQ